MLINPLVSFQDVPLFRANELLAAWKHKMGPVNRPNNFAVCYALFHNDDPVAITVTSTLIAPVLGASGGQMTRDNTIELSRLCAVRPGLCRVAIRLWREFVFPRLGYQYACSYQDASIHTGNTYRFDGWQRLGFSSSGTDSRSGKKGRRKWVWIYPPINTQTLKIANEPKTIFQTIAQPAN